MVDVRPGRPVLSLHAVRFGRERPEAIGVAHRAAVPVGSLQKDVTVHFRVHVHDELVLVIQARGFHERHQARTAAWVDAGAGNRGVDVL